MPISIDGEHINFITDEKDVPAIRSRLLGSLVNPEGKLISAVWEASQVPYLNGELCYYIYEELTYHTNSEYHYWHKDGIAGCLLKTTPRNKALRGTDIENTAENISAATLNRGDSE